VHMAVRALIDGHQFDLQALTELFPKGDPRVIQDDNEDGQYFLEAAELDALFTDPGAMHGAAIAVLAQLVGAARLDDDSFYPVRVVGRYDRHRPAGGTETTIQVTDSAHTRDRVTVVAVEAAESRGQVGAVTILTNGVQVKPEPRGPRYLALAAAHPDVAELLTLVGNAEQLGWIELFKAFEIIHDAVSGGRKGNQTLVATLNIPKSEIKRFTGSANRPDVSGSDARHARQSGEPPKQSMTLPDGRDFIRNLAGRWLDTIA